MDTGEQSDTEEMRRMVEENRKAFERVKEGLRKLKKQMGLDSSEESARQDLSEN